MKVAVFTRLTAMATIGVVVVALAACSSGGTAASKSGSTLNYGELFPITGQISGYVKGIMEGAAIATSVINHAGGVMGHPLNAVAQDTTGDVADAMTGFRSLELKSPVFELGPSSLEINGVISQYDPAHLPDFTSAQLPSLENAHYKYVYRPISSDAIMAKGMAAYAISKHITRAAEVFINTANAQALIPPLTKSYTSHGGTVTANVVLSPSQSSYASEVQQIFATNPQALFMQVDPQTAGTFVRNMESLGDMKVPLIWTDSGLDPLVLGAIGPTIAQRWLTGMLGASPSGSAYTSFLSYWKHYEHTQTPMSQAANLYDAVNLAALAMTAAKSTDGTKWIHFVKQVSQGKGQVCTTYLACVKLLNSGKQINYDGASGTLTFNASNGVTTPFDVVQPQPSGAFKVVLHEPIKMLNRY